MLTGGTAAPLDFLACDLIGGDVSYTFAQAPAKFPRWRNLMQTDPLFVNEAANEVHPQNSSPAIDAGTVITGQSYLGSAPDPGANEMR